MTHKKFETIKRAGRYTTLAAIGMVSAFILMAEPTEGVQVNIAFFMLSKIGALVAIIGNAALLIKWEQEGKLPELSHLMAMGQDEEDEEND